jgi:hypothetical protein
MVWNGSFSLHPCQHLRIFVFLMTAKCDWGEVEVVLICISLVAEDAKYFNVFIGYWYFF